MVSKYTIKFFIYLSTGIFFTGVAYKSIVQTVWEGNPLLFLLVASISILAALRNLNQLLKLNKNDNEE